MAGRGICIFSWRDGGIGLDYWRDGGIDGNGGMRDSYISSRDYGINLVICTITKLLIMDSKKQFSSNKHEANSVIKDIYREYMLCLSKWRD